MVGVARECGRFRLARDSESAAAYADGDYIAHAFTYTRAAMPATPAAGSPDGNLNATPFTRVRLNEVLPRPMNVDWDGNGVADAYDEWVEVFNMEAYPVDLSGWALDDMASSGTAPHEFPAGTVLEAHGFLLQYRSDTGVALNQDTDTARLLLPDGAEVDAFSYVNPAADQSYSRAVDGIGPWVVGYPASPGGPNIAPPHADSNACHHGSAT
jgi:hypothetical protein